jgi:hypothetical protein
MVVEFTAHDSTVGSVIGRNAKEMKWKVMCDIHADPIDVKLNVQEHKLHYHAVSVESNGRFLLPDNDCTKWKRWLRTFISSGPSELKSAVSMR